MDVSNTNLEPVQPADSDGSQTEGSYIPGFRYDLLLPLYDPLHRLLGLETHHRRLIDQAGIEPGCDVLEVGCGTANLALRIRQIHPGADVVGLDPDPKALARARRKAGRARLDLRLARGFAENLPYPDASFDRVFSAFMFHHLTLNQKQTMLSEARRVLRPGGSLHLLDFDASESGTDGFVARLLHRTERLSVNSGDAIQNLMRNAGFAGSKAVGHANMIVGRIAFYRAYALADAPHVTTSEGE